MHTISSGLARRTLDVAFDADEITTGLWQGSYPKEGRVVADSGFDVLVLCANSFQPPASTFPGLVEVIHAPAYDDLYRPVSKVVLHRALEAAKLVSTHIQQGRNVLVTCQAGLNRSGMVSALSLHLMYGWPGDQCVVHVQDRREEALFNEQFVEALRKLKSRDTRTARRDPQEK